MKKLILISTLLLVGCSQEQDTRLVCDCQNTASIENPDKQQRDYLNLTYFGEPEHRDCFSLDRKSSSETLVFNESKKKLLFSHAAWVLSGARERKRTSFANNSIRVFQYHMAPEIDEPISFSLHLDRISLILEATHYSRPIEFFEYEGEFIKVPGFLFREIYQCRVVDGV